MHGEDGDTLCGVSNVYRIENLYSSLSVSALWLESRNQTGLGLKPNSTNLLTILSLSKLFDLIMTHFAHL